MLRKCLYIFIFPFLLTIVQIYGNKDQIDETSILIESYKKLLLADGPVPDSAKLQINIDAIYYDHKRNLNILMKNAGKLKHGGSAKFRRMVEQIESEYAGMDFEVKIIAEDRAKKQTKLCFLRNFTLRIIENGTMLAENKLWRKMTQLQYNWDLSKYKPSEADKEWVKPNCENPQLSNEVLQELIKSPYIESFHVNTIGELMQNFPEFSNFLIEYSAQFPAIKKIAAFEQKDERFRLHLYRKIFDMDKEVAAKAEAWHALKLMMEGIEDLEAKLGQKYQAELRANRTKLYILLTIIHLFAENSLLCKICPLIDYLQFLTKKSMINNKLKWKTPSECYEMEPEKQFYAQRPILAKCHIDFLANQFEHNPTGEIVEMLRNNVGTTDHLKRMVGNFRVYELWKYTEVRTRMINSEFFNNKMRLLGHYHHALVPSDSSSDLGSTLLGHRLGADLMVWMTHYERILSENVGGGEVLPKIMENVWLFFRIGYDESQIPKNAQINHLSHVLMNFIPKLDNFFARLKNDASLDYHQANLLLNDLEQHSHRDADVQWRGSELSSAEPILFLKQLHFRELINLLASETDLETVEEFRKLREVLRENKNARQNMMRFLTLEDIKQFFEANAIEFNEAEFVIRTDQKRDQKDQGSVEHEQAKKIEIINKKKTEKNRRRKEMRKEKKKMAEKSNSNPAESGENSEGNFTNQKPETGTETAMETAIVSEQHEKHPLEKEPEETTQFVKNVAEPEKFREEGENNEKVTAPEPNLEIKDFQVTANNVPTFKDKLIGNVQQKAANFEENAENENSEKIGENSEFNTENSKDKDELQNEDDGGWNVVTKNKKSKNKTNNGQIQNSDRKIGRLGSYKWYKPNPNPGPGILGKSPLLLMNEALANAKTMPNKETKGKKKAADVAEESAKNQNIVQLMINEDKKETVMQPVKNQNKVEGQQNQNNSAMKEQIAAEAQLKFPENFNVEEGPSSAIMFGTIGQ